MEIGQYPASSCSKEHQKIYQEWFALADAGPIPAPLLCFPSIPNLQFHCCAPGCGLLIDGVADGDGRITGPDAIKFFGMSKLSRPDLKQVLALATSPHPLSCFVLLAELLVFICVIFFCLTVLRFKVWAIADTRRQGYLGFPEFVTAMQVFPRLFDVSVVLSVSTR
jgi:EH domain-containing protein 1